jgi:hypothetical protein
MKVTLRYARARPHKRVELSLYSLQIRNPRGKYRRLSFWHFHAMSQERAQMFDPVASRFSSMPDMPYRPCDLQLLELSNSPAADGYRSPTRARYRMEQSNNAESCSRSLLDYALRKDVPIVDKESAKRSMRDGTRSMTCIQPIQKVKIRLGKENRTICLDKYQARQERSLVKLHLPAPLYCPPETSPGHPE